MLSNNANPPPNHRPGVDSRAGWVLVALITSQASGTSV
jgi:hypothetical protein